ncbi:hypothetical protein L3X38_024847 [Prunus dulcis]|uniref:Uncharacterized protein n=1 Tax=Prunus dulcis TaxID=3755 RepID=A0AAD4W258_PRUDU|nr:hypothetical protein L3X38_024847 [Prunus dulcis]
MTQAPGTPREQPPRGPAKVEQWQQMPPEPGDPNSVQSSSTYHRLTVARWQRWRSLQWQRRWLRWQGGKVATVAAAVAEVAAAVARWQGGYGGKVARWQGGYGGKVARWQGGKVARRLRWHRRWLR